MMIENNDIDDLYQEFYIDKRDDRILKTFSLDDRQIFRKEEKKNVKNLFEIMKQSTNLIKCYVCGEEKLSKFDLKKCKICPRKVCSGCLNQCYKCDVECCRECCSTREYKEGSYLTCNLCTIIK